MTDLRHLTQVAPQIVALAAEIRSLAGDDDLAFVDSLEGESNIVGIARGAVQAMHAWEAQGEAAKALSQRYDARAKDFGARAERVRSALFNFMGEIDCRTLALPEATLTLAEPSSQSLVEHADADPNKLSPALRRTKMEPDKAAIKAALQRGETVPGYSLANSKPVLKFRVGKGGGEANNLPAEADR